MQDIALHILDLVQNAVAAGATIIKIDVVEDHARDTLQFVISDNGCGMDEQFRRQVLDPFVTSRTTRRVGLGLPLLDMSAQQAGGHLVIESQPGIGTIVRATFQHSHLDRPPLGNMAETLLVIIAGSPERDIHYYHRVDTREFSFKLSEIKDQLEDVPVTHPEVIGWLKNFLTASFTELYGGGEIEDT